MSTMKELVEGLVQQLRHGMELGRQVQVKRPATEIRNVVVAGLGGSGIGANLVQAIIAPELKVPFMVSKAYDLPAFIDEHTLFIASSFSGNTEETLTSLKEAFARKCTVIAITSGGSLLEQAQQHHLDHALIPGESKSPRACLGYNFIQLLYVLKGAGLISCAFEAELEAGIALLEQQYEAIQQTAASLARKMDGRLPILYADSRFEAVAVRAQQQINENGKQLCHVNVFPEMNHNELVGWVHPEEVYQRTAVVLFRSSFNHPRVNVRMDICKPIFEEKAADVMELEAQGNSFLEQALYLIYVFDWVSIYLAEQNGIDPKPVKVIDYLKNELAKA